MADDLTGVPEAWLAPVGRVGSRPLEPRVGAHLLRLLHRPADGPSRRGHRPGRRLLRRRRHLQIGALQNPTGNRKGGPLYGEFASIRVDGGDPSQRPAAPTLAAKTSGEFGHLLEINRAAPAVRSALRRIRGQRRHRHTAGVLRAQGRTCTTRTTWSANQNGTTRDRNGVDSPATLDRSLKGTRGTAALDALALKLPSSIAWTCGCSPSTGTARQSARLRRRPCWDRRRTGPRRHQPDQLRDRPRRHVRRGGRKPHR